MTESELIELIISKRNELEENRAINVSSSLLRVQEEDINELEEIFATGDIKRLELRIFLDQCAEKADEPTEMPASPSQSV
ncbi:hypothetical protein ACFLTB_01895 [Chloroflexota bacterium]